MFLKSFRFWFFAVFLFYIFSSSIYAVASLVKHSHYETFIDLAVFNQGIWQYSKFQWPVMTLHLNRPFLGDHLHPILIVIAPLYWIYGNEKTLLFIQPFIILSAIIPLFLIGLRLTKSFFFSFCIIFAYSLYIPLQYTIFYDFHEIVFLAPLFAWTYYFYIIKRKYLVSLFLFLCLLIKEEVGFFVATFGLYILIANKEWRKFGLLWFIFGTIYSLMTMYFVIPKIGGSYLYFDYGNLGKTPIDVIINLFKNPVLFFKSFFEPAVKLETLYRTFWPFAFLPLISPLGILLSFEQFFSRFIDLKTTTRWTIGYHYSVPMTIVVAISTIWSANLLNRFIRKRGFLILLGIIILFLTRIEQINTSAILLIKNPVFWQRYSWMDSIDKAISILPSDASVATQNNIIPHLSTRKYIYTLDQKNQAKFILVDLHKGQSAYNFFGEEKWQQIERDIKKGVEDGKYTIIFNEEDAYLLKQ